MSAATLTAPAIAAHQGTIRHIEANGDGALARLLSDLLTDAEGRPAEREELERLRSEVDQLTTECDNLRTEHLALLERLEKVEHVAVATWVRTAAGGHLMAGLAPDFVVAPAPSGAGRLRLVPAGR